MKCFCLFQAGLTVHHLEPIQTAFFSQSRLAPRRPSSNSDQGSNSAAVSKTSVLQFDLEPSVLHGESPPQKDGHQQEPSKVLQWLDPSDHHPSSWLAFCAGNLSESVDSNDAYDLVILPISVSTLSFHHHSPLLRPLLVAAVFPGILLGKTLVFIRKAGSSKLHSPP
ncbi:uncharacterized protein PGTG_11620 [Puccinia graminis f. sp. tritici CRL 75-36-700-3]|uniref:Uncharacterized protein n=1 Tax=Puccinia graminis f. sp. tritici (strain CRL 75-36-700-3 / race SCCL) TaxID=418459 RepID=E3KNI9_PUCGT|nr:uncharacterized protein PGTG_11620 [Puccinia graminis f. sp. tritici CRL 75-36-700-3]EFP85864.2 hypothetical protein PGTG_11620 [Puccinia graminis f. sp. tritici CRL 75-36-700-3]